MTTIILTCLWCHTKVAVAPLAGVLVLDEEDHAWRFTVDACTSCRIPTQSQPLSGLHVREVRQAQAAEHARIDAIVRRTLERIGHIDDAALYAAITGGDA